MALGLADPADDVLGHRHGEGLDLDPAPALKQPLGLKSVDEVKPVVAHGDELSSGLGPKHENGFNRRHRLLAKPPIKEYLLELVEDDQDVPQGPAGLIDHIQQPRRDLPLVIGVNAIARGRPYQSEPTVRIHVFAEALGYSVSSDSVTGRLNALGLALDRGLAGARCPLLQLVVVPRQRLAQIAVHLQGDQLRVIESSRLARTAQPLIQQQRKRRERLLVRILDEF